MENCNKKIKKKPSKLEDMTKEQIREAILKKKECNSKAQTIVESLLEKGVTEKYFLHCLPDINQTHFEDIIEERSIIHLCGYPVCQKILTQTDIPKQKYRISVKTNKVYDITVRKSFCSNSCYKAAMHVKKQMLTSPLWFREYEEIPKFFLLSLDSVGSMGQEVDVSLIDRVKMKSEKEFTSINDFASASFNEISGSQNADNEEILYEDRKTNIENELIHRGKYSEPQQSNENNIGKNNNLLIKLENKPSENTIQTNESVTLQSVKNKEETKKSTPNPLNIVGDIIEKPERKIDPILTHGPAKVNNKETSKPSIKTTHKKQPMITALTNEVEKCLAEWFSIDTILYLFGEEKVKEMVADKGECIKEYLNNYAQGIFYNSNTYDQYQALCKKLNMLEMEDKKFDAQTLQRETKPLPDYSIIQEESKRMQLKVKAFFAGETEIPITGESEPHKPVTENKATTQIPLVDKNAQNALRRRIVCEHLNKVLPDLLRSLGLLSLSINSDVRLLVNTFKLKANNIMFKPIQWTLIAIIVIKTLSLRDKRLEYLLEQSTAYQHMQLLLLSYEQDGGYLDRLIIWLTDIDRHLNTNDTHLTIE